MSHMAKFVVALVVLLVMAIAASRQLFLFAVFRGPQGFLDSPGGRYHLWLAVSACITACIAAGLMFHFFLRHERNKWLKVAIAPIGPPPNALVHNSSTKPTPVPSNPRRWALANSWLAEGQADDRTPMDSSVVADSGGTPAAQRAFARRSHQAMFKNWSQARHD